MRPSTVLALLIALSAPTLVHAMSDKEIAGRFCQGMTQQFVLPDNTRADCISETHAIEVEKTQYWHQSLSQALHYSLWTREIAENPAAFSYWNHAIKTPHRAGIILFCEKDRDTCTGHTVRLFRLIEEFDMPVTVWDCRETDLALDQCQKLRD